MADGLNIRFIDLFAGIGGMRIPFDEFGECVLTSEKDAHARFTYSRYFRELETEIDADVEKLGSKVDKDFPDHDLLLAGFPCQPFSNAGKKKGFQDTRGTLFFSIANIARVKQPKVLLLENVRGLLTHDSSRTFEVITNSLEEIGYFVHFRVLNARDFGLPQNRNRLFIVAIRKDIPFAGDYQFPLATHDRNSLRLGEILESNPSSNLTISDKLWIGHIARKERNRANGKGFGYQIFTESSPYAATLSARYYKDGSEVLIAQKGKNPRKISPREAARLQGFPENFEPHYSAKEAYKQFGNAVPINIVSALASSLLTYFK